MLRPLLHMIFTLTFICLVMVAPIATYAQKPNPPLNGDMLRLEVFDQPIQVTDIMMSSKSGGLTYLSEYRRRWIVLNIWATWCPPCVVEMPTLNALQKANKKRVFKVIAISLEKDPEVVDKFMKDNNLDALMPFIDANDDVKKQEAFQNVAGVPVTLILNPEMEAVARFQGDTNWNSPEAQAVLDYFMDDGKQSEPIPATNFTASEALK